MIWLHVIAEPILTCVVISLVAYAVNLAIRAPAMVLLAGFRVMEKALLAVFMLWAAAVFVTTIAVFILVATHLGALYAVVLAIPTALVVWTMLEGLRTGDRARYPRWKAQAAAPRTEG